MISIFRGCASFSIGVVFVLLSQFLEADLIYILPVPGMDPLKQFYDEYSVRDECAKPFCKLREALEDEGYEIVFIKGGEKLDPEASVISFNGVQSKFLRTLLKVKSQKRFLVAFEPHVVMPQLYGDRIPKYFDKIFVMFDDYIDDKKYFKLYYPQPRLAPLDQKVAFDQKKLCTLINGKWFSRRPLELYSQRVKIVKFFEALGTDEFDVYGKGWEGHQSWKGYVDSKWETLVNYKFCICYENMHTQNGYITEKIFDCLIGRCVPVYWGASNIGDYIPSDCFIDRRLFASDEELYHYLSNMDEETHEKYLSAGQAYLGSPESEYFSIEYFVDLIVGNLRE